MSATHTSRGELAQSLKLPLSACFVTFTLITFSVVSAQETVGPRLDPHKVVGAQNCGECHKKEYQTWQSTHHYKTFLELHRSPKAKEITDALNANRSEKIRRIKSERLCQTCHYTVQADQGADTFKATTGISCESCHGPAVDWVKLHNDYGGKDVKKESETADHKKMRIAKSVENGMIRPDRLYDVAANCYQCHTVPQEELVNTGGHPAGSAFELVAWSQGEVRHNFMRTNDKENAKAPIDRKRMMYVVGKILDVEYAIRGLSKATVKGTFIKKMAVRLHKARKDLSTIDKASNIPELKQIMEAVTPIQLKFSYILANQKSLGTVADKVSSLGRELSANHDGSKLSALDSMLPTEYKGTPAE